MPAVPDGLKAEPGDLLLFVADTWKITCKALYALRQKIGAEMKVRRHSLRGCCSRRVNHSSPRRRKMSGERRQDFSPWAVLAALVLLPLDVALRRFSA